MALLSPLALTQTLPFLPLAQGEYRLSDRTPR